MGYAVTKQRLSYLARAAMLREAAGLLADSTEKTELLAEAAACHRMAQQAMLGSTEERGGLEITRGLQADLDYLAWLRKSNSAAQAHIEVCSKLVAESQALLERTRFDLGSRRGRRSKQPPYS